MPSLPRPNFAARTAAAAVVGASLALTASAARAAQVAGFPDIPANHWAADSVSKLAKAGIVQGSSSMPLGAPPAAGIKVAQAGKKPAYNGDKPVTRYEAAVLLWRFVQYIDTANGMKKGSSNALLAPSVDGPTAVKKLIAAGYLKKTSPLATNGEKLVTANQLADALAEVIAKNREKVTPVTPDSESTLPIEKPQSAGKSKG